MVKILLPAELAICTGDEEVGAVCSRLLEANGADAGAAAGDDRVFADADAAEEVVNGACEAAGIDDEGL